VSEYPNVPGYVVPEFEMQIWKVGEDKYSKLNINPYCGKFPNPSNVNPIRPGPGLFPEKAKVK